MSEERVIEQLRRKLALLVEHEHFTNLEDIAQTIGTNQKTLESWADYGSNKVTKGLVPKQHYQSILDIFTNPIRKHHGEVNFEDIIKGKVNELGHYLSKTPRLTFYKLVEHEAITNSGKIFRDQKNDLSAVKRRSEQTPITKFSVTTNQWFWIEFQTELASLNAITLQQRENDWAFGDVEYITDDKQLIIPGLRSDGFPDSIKEVDWDGINSFYVLQCQRPWPQQIMDAIKSNTPIDNSELQTIADHYASNSSETRCLFAIEIDIKRG